MAAGATYEPIQSYTLGSASASISFTSIPSTYTDLRIVVTGVLSGTGSAATITFNAGWNGSDTSYGTTRLIGDGSAASSDRNVNYPAVYLSYGAASNTTPWFFSCDIFSYANTSTYKTCLHTASQDLNGSGVVGRNVTCWRNTSAISSIYVNLSGGTTYASGTTATLYGIKAA